MLDLPQVTLDVAQYSTTPFGIVDATHAAEAATEPILDSRAESGDAGAKLVERSHIGERYRALGTASHQ